jgi:hypothetical protein
MNLTLFHKRANAWLSIAVVSLGLLPSVLAQEVKPPPNIAAAVGIPAYKPPQWRITVKSKPEYIHGQAYYVYTVTNIRDTLSSNEIPYMGYFCRSDYRAGSPLMGEKRVNSEEMLYYCPRALYSVNKLKGVRDGTVLGATEPERWGDAIAFTKSGYISSHQEWRPWLLDDTERSGFTILFLQDEKSKSPGLLPGKSITIKLALVNNQLSREFQTMNYIESEWDNISDPRPNRSYFLTRVYPIIVVP